MMLAGAGVGALTLVITVGAGCALIDAASGTSSGGIDGGTVASDGSADGGVAARVCARVDLCWGPPMLVPLGVSARQVQIADFDGDGSDDIAVAGDADL